MSGATYRIEAEHTPGEAFNWYVRVWRLSDDFMPVYTVHDETAEAAVSRARMWIASQNVKQGSVSLYVDDEGQDADAPHSVKA